MTTKYMNLFLIIMSKLGGMKELWLLLLVVTAIVGVEVSLLGKTFPTDRTNIWPFTSVCTLMFNKMVFPLKTLSTKSTCKRSTLVEKRACYQRLVTTRVVARTTGCVKAWGPWLAWELVTYSSIIQAIVQDVV